MHTQVHLGKPNDMDGFGLEVEIQVEGVSQELVDAGHEVSHGGGCGFWMGRWLSADWWYRLVRIVGL